jgi:hypothetical protein
MTQWQETLAKLPWTPEHAERSARLALSQAAWLGIDRDDAIRAVFEMAMDGFFEANPHILYQAWETVSEEITHPDPFELLAA